MALLGALCVCLNALGFTNRSLRAQVSQLLGVPASYTVNQMSYDLARLRRKGLIARRPGTNTYDLTAEGQRVAIFYTKVHDRILGPSSPPTNPQHHHRYDEPSPPSNAPSPHEPNKPSWERPPENSRQPPSIGTPSEASERRRCRPASRSTRIP